MTIRLLPAKNRQTTGPAMLVCGPRRGVSTASLSRIVQVELTFSSLVQAKARKDAIMNGIEGNMALSRICKESQVVKSELCL